MTNKMKTVQKPRLIFLACENSQRLAELISNILDFCSYNNCINNFSENTDFVIETLGYGEEYPENVIADTVLYDGGYCRNKHLGEFRQRVTAYENIDSSEDEALTYSTDNYGADLACRNISEYDNTMTLDIVGNGILSRISLDKNKYSVGEVLACMGVLTASGLPLAAISGYFTSDINS